MSNATDVVPEEPASVDDSDDAASPHDALFYKTFSKPEHAAAELMRVLPSALAARIEWETLIPLSIKFVDAKLSGRYADVLYSVRIDGRETLIYFLLEHKSESDTWTPLQLLEYKTRIWRAYVEDPNNKGKSHLPVIIPVVVHHSERGWTGALRFRELFDVAHESAELLSQFMLDFGILLDDISKVSGEVLSQLPITPEGRLVLFALRFGRTPDRLFQELPKIVPVLLMLRAQPHGTLVIAAIIVYLKTVGKVREAEVRVALQQAVGNSIADEILFGAERRYEQGVREAERKGKREGKHEGKREALQLILEQRFGAIPNAARTRLDAATTKDLDAMMTRVLSAASLDEVLG
jgi:predicted transposase YdaD